MNESSHVAITSTIASPIATISRPGEVTGRVASRRSAARSTACARDQSRYAFAPMTTDAPPQPSYPPSLLAFAIFYGGMVCIAGVLGNKQVALRPLAVESGTFALLLRVLTPT